MNLFDTLASGALTEELSNTTTSYPILAAGTYTFSIKSAEKVATKDGSGEYLLIQLALGEEATDVDGNPLNPGYGLRHMIYGTVTEKVTQESILKNIARFQDCFGIPREEWDETFESWIGLEGQVSTKVGQERTDARSGQTYPPQTEISSLIPAG